MRRVRFGTRGLLLTVAFSAVGLAFYRVVSREDADTDFGLGLVIASAAVLAIVRMVGEIARCRAAGKALTLAQIASLFLGSTLIAAAIIGISDLSFLIVHQFARTLGDRRIMEHGEPRPLYDLGILAGVTVAVLVASRLRQAFWTSTNARPRPGRPRWIMLWPIGAVALLALAMGIEQMRERWEFCRMMVSYHAGRKSEAVDRNEAVLHAWLKREYERTMWRPWLPLHPDPPRRDPKPR